jgi:hypothetical protein
MMRDKSGRYIIDDDNDYQWGPLEPLPNYGEIEKFNILMKLGAGDLVEVPWSMIVDDARIRHLVNYLINVGKMRYAANMDAAIPTESK